MQGFVYALINPSLPQMVKVGKTERHPEKRAQELSAATGVPTPFIVGFSVQVRDCDAAETFAHELLTQRGYRIADNREFFNASLNDVVKVLIECEKLYQLIVVIEQVQEGDPGLMSDEDSTQTLIDSLVDQGMNLMQGENGSFIDHHSAKERFEAASKLGEGRATYWLGYVLTNAESTVYDLRRGLTTLQLAVQQGFPAVSCYLRMGEVYFNVGENQNSEIAHKKAFEDEQLRNIFERYQQVKESPEMVSALEATTISSKAKRRGTDLIFYFSRLEYGHAPFVASTFLFEFMPLIRPIAAENLSDALFQHLAQRMLDGMDRYERNFKDEISAFRATHIH